MMKVLKSLVFSFFAFVSFPAFSAAENTLEAVPKNLHIYSSSGSTYVDHRATGYIGD